MASFIQGQWPSWSYTETTDTFPQYSPYSPANNYSTYLADSMETYQTHHHHLIHQQQISRTTESKPRLSKDEVDILEAEFQKNHKPNSNTKKALAESMRVDNARINNWFQNRRAREKKEKNIREYEARQKLEKERTGDREAGNVFLSGPSRDLVASSAPFPNAQGESRRLTSTQDESSDYDQETESTNAFESVLPTIENCENLLDGLVGADVDFPSSTDDEESENFMSQITRPIKGEALHGDAVFDYTLESPRSNAGAQLRSPPNIDIASRRNRRPPVLSINSSPNYSSGPVKSGLDLGRRAENTNTIRRVSSASGSSRISKPTMASSRAVYHHPVRATAEAYKMKRSPVISAPKNPNAPPTPDTPIVANQPMIGDIATQQDSDCDSGGKMAAAPDAIIYDPTLRTPPTTPGVTESLFGLSSMYDMSIPGGSLVESGIPTYHNNFDMQATMPMSISSYMAHDGSNRPQTSAFGQMNTGYSNFCGGAAEYQWPGVPEPHHHHLIILHKPRIT